MATKKKKSVKKGRILIVVLVVLVLGIFLYLQLKPKLIVVTVTDRIEEYDYYIESNATKIQKKYFEELKKYIDEKSNIEEDYVKIISKLFVTEFYTLDNKVTNKDVGGVQYVHPNVKNEFINEASNGMYKYIKNNLYRNRKQKLPDVEKVSIEDVSNTRYNDNGIKDNDAYLVKTKIKYKKDYDYPEEVSLILVHDNNKLEVVEVE